MGDLPSELTAALGSRYRVLRELGRGGMATVYLAEDLKHHREVAVKVLHPELAAALGHERFLREIEIAAGLSHPHILPVYDSGETGGFLYYVMPYVEGESLRDRIVREKQLPLDDALALAREVADALSYAHAKGIIHRDIKPENVLLQSGHAVVADFGIARAVDAAGGDRLTGTGLSVGTPPYMSPEQAAGESDLDGRSDLYALGCMLYEMLGGQPPFSGPTVESVVHQHLSVDPRPISEIRPAVPAEIVGVLQRSLAKNPADRFNPVAQFADALRAGRTTTASSPATASPPRTLMRWPLWIAGAALIVVGAALGVQVFGGGSEPGATVTDIPSVAVLPFVDLSGGANEYLGDGLAETLIHALSGVEGLRVTARTSAFSFKGRNEDVRTIAEALGVEAVLEGSVQRAGDRLRITAQLVNASDGFHLWSESFDRDVSDVFAVQDEVAQAVVAALEVELVGDGTDFVVDAGTESVEAYNTYLQGLFFWNKRTAPDLERAAELFHRAIEADSGFARAWSTLSSTYILFLPSTYDVRTISPSEALARAERAAREAIGLDEGLGEAHAALAGIMETLGRNDEARQSYERAIELDPRHASARQWYGTFLATVGEVDAGLEQIREAERLDPVSLIIMAEVGELLDAVGRRDEATTQYERVLDLYPETLVSSYFAGTHFLVERDFVRAADLLGRTIGVIDTAAGRSFAEGVRDPASRATTLRAVGDTSRFADVAMAAHRSLGDDDAAIAALERVVEGPYFDGIYLPNILAVLGPELSAQPRTQALIRRLASRLRERYR